MRAMKNITCTDFGERFSLPFFHQDKCNDDKPAIGTSLAKSNEFQGQLVNSCNCSRFYLNFYIVSDCSTFEASFEIPISSLIGTPTKMFERERENESATEREIEKEKERAKQGKKKVQQVSFESLAYCLVLNSNSFNLKRSGFIFANRIYFYDRQGSEKEFPHRY